MDLTVLIPVAVAIVAPIGAYIVAARRMSGKIETSDANALWEESRSIREDYRARLTSVTDRARELEARVAKLESINDALSRENYELKVQIIRMEALIKSLEANITSLKSLIRTLENNIDSQKTPLQHLEKAIDAQKTEVENGT